MTGESNNLRRLREQKGWSLPEAAKAMSMSDSGYLKLERGERNLTSASIKRAAEAFGVSKASVVDDNVQQIAAAQTVAINEGNWRPPPMLMNTRDTMPVYASAEGGNGQIIVTTDEIDRVPRPFTLEGIPDAYAILITGESMDPAYRPGDYAWVNPKLPPQRDSDCILYSINEEAGEVVATIKALKRWDREAWHLVQHNPKKEFSLDRGIWTRHHRVVGNFRRR